MARTDSNVTTHIIAKIFREYIVDANGITSEYSYKAASSMLERLDFVLDDVSVFASMISGKYFSDEANYWTAGLFVSAAINKIIKKDDIITLDFVSLGSSADCIGYKLKQGKISLKGDAGDYLGENMSGGSIAIHGNAGFYAGFRMSGGDVTIHGNIEDQVGTYMSGGAIRIEGKVGSIPESCRGRIYHREKLLR